MARHPWLTFVLVGLVPALLLSGNVLGRAVSLAALFPALAAVLVISDGDDLVATPGHRVDRILVALGAWVVLIGVELMEGGLAAPLWTLLVAGVPAAIAAWVLSGVYSPSPRVRSLVRSLGTVRGSCAAWVVALVAWPAAATLAVLVCSRLPGVAVLSPVRPSAGLHLAGWIATGVFSSALAAVGWYGFAARRLLPRLSPLLTGLLIGVLQWLLVWGISLSPDALTEPLHLWGLTGSAATGVATVWVYERSRGSLLPVWLMGSILVAAHWASFLAILPEAGRAALLTEAFAVTRLGVAIVLVVAGRMWRAPAATPEPVGSERSLP